MKTQCFGYHTSTTELEKGGLDLIPGCRTRILHVTQHGKKIFFFSANLIHSFHRSEIWTYCVWVLCSNSHRDVSRLCPYLEPRVFPRLTQLVGRVKFLVVVGLRFPCWLWEGTCSQLLEASCVPYHMPLPSSKLAMGTLMKNPCNTSHLSTFGL